MREQLWTYWALWLGVGYLCGAVPFGLLIGKIKGVDIREHGSKSIGATNCGRVLGKKFGIGCFVLDVLKGVLPVLGYGVTRVVAEGGGGALGLLLWVSVGIAAVIGHMFPVWLKFKGGKGVATGLGVLLGFWPVMTLGGVVAAVIWLITVKLSAYVSLASMLAACSLPISCVVLGLAFGVPGSHIGIFAGVTGVLAGLVVLRHKANVARLMAGTENKAAWAVGKKAN